MTFEIIQGDLFDREHLFDALAQGVNCQGIMGGGIAVTFREKFPAMHDDYQRVCMKFGDALGGLIHVTRGVPEPSSAYRAYTLLGPAIYNLFSQVMMGENGDYRLLQQAAISMLFDAEEMQYTRVGLPWIGCGIAGLERHNVEHIFRSIFGDSDVEFVLVEQPTV
jgi:O-acetyl-ADP-ribose deacetylase (regulator of RNase III)